MAFNPLREEGIPFEKQVKNWDELNVEPYDKNEVHPYTRTRIILMNGIEEEAAMFGHQFACHMDDYALKQKLAQVRRIEQQQQKLVNWLILADELSDSAGYFTWQHLVNVDGSAPSQRVVEQHIDRHGQDYRLETEGPHPIEELRARETVKA